MARRQVDHSKATGIVTISIPSSAYKLGQTQPRIVDVIRGDETNLLRSLACGLFKEVNVFGNFVCDPNGRTECKFVSHPKIELLNIVN